MTDLANVRRGRDLTAYFRFGQRAGAGRREEEKKLPWPRQLALQLILLAITFTVLFPILWIFSISVDSRGGCSGPRASTSSPTSVTFGAYQKVLAQPTSNDISFLGLMFNSLKIARPELGRRGRPRCHRGLCVLAPEVRGSRGPDDRDPRRPDAARGRDPDAAVRVPQPVPLRDRRHQLQPAGVAARRVPGRHLRPAAVRDLEPEGLPRHHPARPRGGGLGRRRDPEPDVPAGGAAARDACDRGHRVPRLPRWLDRIPDRVPVHRRPGAGLDAVDRAQLDGRPVRAQHAVVGVRAPSRSCSRSRCRWCSSSSSATWWAGSPEAASRGSGVGGSAVPQRDSLRLERRAIQCGRAPVSPLRPFGPCRRPRRRPASTRTTGGRPAARSPPAGRSRPRTAPAP